MNFLIAGLSSVSFFAVIACFRNYKTKKATLIRIAVMSIFWIIFLIGYLVMLVKFIDKGEKQYVFVPIVSLIIFNGLLGWRIIKDVLRLKKDDFENAEDITEIPELGISVKKEKNEKKPEKKQEEKKDFMGLGSSNLRDFLDRD